MPDEIEPQQRLYLDRLQEEYHRRYGAAVDLIKAQVGPGIEFANTAGRVVISDNGAWFECFDLPMEFSGAAGAPVRYRYASDAEAVSLLGSLADRRIADSGGPSSILGLFALYSRKGIADGSEVFAFQHASGHGEQVQTATSIGALRQGALPLLFRARVELPEPLPGTMLKRGVICCLCGVGEGNLILEMAYDSPNLKDLASSPMNEMAQ